MTTTTEPAPVARRLRALGQALDWQITRLQDEYLRGSPSARGELARLRRGLGKPAGSVPEIWELTVGAVPDRLRGDRDEPNRAEQAAHAALTLYALNQQSLTVPAHVPGVSFGAAVRGLARSGGPSADAVARRFMAVATAESIGEVLAHMRGLVTQLKRVEPLPRRGMDYARLADDLNALLTPGHANGVRLAWGRDFYRTATDKPDGHQTEE